jgi:organic hydroperoxide reductase OsmC/OhrA
MTMGTATAERGGENSAVARWRGGWRCDVDAGGFTLVVDEPPGAGGTGLGPMPTDLFLASLSSCYALALAWAARKQGFELPDLEVTATGTYAGLRFAALELTVSTTLDDERLSPLLEPARRVCYVSNTLAGTATLTVSLAPSRG